MVLFTLATVLIDAAISNADKPFIKSDSRIMSAQPRTEQRNLHFFEFQIQMQCLSNTGQFEYQRNVFRTLHIFGRDWKHKMKLRRRLWDCLNLYILFTAWERWCKTPACYRLSHIIKPGQRNPPTFTDSNISFLFAGHILHIFTYFRMALNMSLWFWHDKAAQIACGQTKNKTEWNWQFWSNTYNEILGWKYKYFIT